MTVVAEMESTSLDAARALAAAATPRPWAWFGNTDVRNVYIATTRFGRRFVMQFRRWGMYGAQPVFRTSPGDDGRMVPSAEIPRYEVLGGATIAEAGQAPYRADIVGFASPDACLLIQAANEYEHLLALEDYVRHTGIAWHLGTSYEVQIGEALGRLDVLREAIRDAA